MMEILLTGSSGFIGNYFIQKYQEKYKISTFSFRNNDFNKLNLENIKTVIHLSGLVHQMNGALKEEYEKVNIIQTIDLANKVKQGGVNHFIFMSTIAVYGIETGIIKENSCCNPITDYGITKLKAENELLKLQDSNFKVSIIRPPIVNGYNAPGNMRILIKLIQNAFILPFGKIYNKRSMVYVGNLCNLIDELIIQQKKGVFLVTDDEAISTTKLIELISKNLDKKVYIIKIPFFQSLLKLVKPSFHKRLFESLEVDNSKTKEVLNLINLYSVEEGIKYMIKDEKWYI